jgi:restriction endonuclease S subunit
MFINKKTKWDVEKIYNIEDVIGEIYEAFINGYTKTNSKLSQFFTPRNLMYLILSFFKKDLRAMLKEKQEFHVGDFCMGTAGWLVIFYNMFREKYGEKIKLSGGEVKPNTFQYAMMNLITTLDGMPFYVQRDNSLTHVDDKKYDLIVTNPPFKTDFKFSNVKQNFESDKYTIKNEIKIDDVYKLQNNNPPIQFLELCIYKLNDMGKCIIVLPYGELFSGSSYRKSRKYFLDTIDITHIIICPSGIFTHTGILSCIMIFNKDDTGTKEITFLETNKECTTLTKITSISRIDIEKEQNLSFYHNDYLKDKNKYNSNIEYVEFGDIFELEKGKLQSSKVVEDKKSDILFVSKCELNEEIEKKLQSDDYYNGGLFIAHAFNGNGKCPIRYTEKKCIHSNLMNRCVLKKQYDDKINLKFIYYYLNNIKKYIEETYSKGSCNKSLDVKNFNKMKIPFPSIAVQNEIADKVGTLYDSVNRLVETISDNNKFIKWYVECSIKECDNIKYKKLIDVCEFLGCKHDTSFGKQKGKYKFHTGGIRTDLYVDEYDIDKLSVIINRTNGSGKCNIFLDKNFSSATQTMVFTANDETITKYIYYYFVSNIYRLEQGYKGSNHKNITTEFVSNIEIPVPPTEKQKTIVTYCDQLKKENDEAVNRCLMNSKLIKKIFKTYFGNN